MASAARRRPQPSQCRIVSRPDATPLHHSSNAANDSAVINVSGSATVNFCSNSGQKMNDSAANSDALKLA